MLSINQRTAQIKLTEAWKASRDEDYPLQMKREGTLLEEAKSRNLRLTARKEMQEGGKTRQAEKSFVRDAGKFGTKPRRK